MSHISYEIRIAGVVPEDARDDLQDVDLVDVPPSTLLSGSVADQAALLGLIARVRSLGLEIEEVRRLLAPPDDPATR